MTSNIPIEFSGVSISFGAKQVLTDVSFRLGGGETLILLGVTGSGKSVLLKLVATLLKPDSGQILIEGEDTALLGETGLNALRKHMGIVFQEGALFDSLSVYENVAYPMRESRQNGEEKIEQAVRQVLGFVEMEEAIDKMPAELSGGMRRRVSVARAIVTRPEIMLYDSPTAGLDPVTANTINILIAKLRDLNGVASIVVTQRVQDALFLSDVFFSQGNQKTGQPRDASKPATWFMVLRDQRVYFWGKRDELIKSHDPYLLEFIS